MPRVNASNGVRPEIRALAVMKLNEPVTPAVINQHVGTGDYAAKYISFLKNRYGFDFTVQKDGRTVVSYTMVKEPENVAELRSAQPKAKAVKAPKQPKEKKAKAAKKPAKSAKDKNMATLKKVLQKRNRAAGIQKEFEALEAVGLGIPNSTNVDGDFDSYDGNVRDLIV